MSIGKENGGETDGASPRSRYLYMALVGLTLLPIYISTAYRSVAGGDSGELVAQACRLGVAHPPGYPLFTLLNYAPTRLLRSWGGTPAFRANVLSSIFDTASAMLLFACAELWMRGTKYYNLEAAAGAAVLYGVSPLIWLYALGGEVFSLNNLFVALVLYLTIRHAKFGREQDVYLGAFVCGLAMTNQHTIVLFEVPLIARVLYREYATHRRLSFGMVRRAATMFLIGLSPYVFLPLSAHLLPDGGGWGDLRTVTGFVRHLRRADYGTFALFSGNKEGRQVAGLFRRLTLYAHDVFARQTLGTGALPLMAIVGIVVSVFVDNGVFGLSNLKRATRKSRKTAKGASRATTKRVSTSFTTCGRDLLVAYGFYMISFHSLSNIPLDEGLLFGVHARFWQQPNAVFYVFCACGAGVVGTYVPNSFRRVLTFTIASVAVSAQVSRWWSELDMSDANYLVEYGRALMDPLPKGAVLLASYDLQWTVSRYLQECENYRSDIVLLSQPMMSYRWFSEHQSDYSTVVFPGTHLVAGEQQRRGDAISRSGFTISEFIESNLDRFPAIHLGGPAVRTDKRYNSATYDRIYHGLTFQALPVAHARYVEQTMSASAYFDTLSRSWAVVRAALPKLPHANQFHEETWEFMVARDYWAKAGKATSLLAHLATTANPTDATYGIGLTQSARAGEEILANEALEDLSRFGLTLGLLKNTGLAYVRLVKGRVDLPESIDLFAPLSTFSNEPREHVHFDAKFEDPFRNAREWKGRASVRALELWSKWLEFPGSKTDPQHSTIARTVAVLMGASK